jgi:hypothetical protein
MCILIHRCVGRSQVVEKLVEAWRADHEDAMFVRDLEELAAECIDLGQLLRHAWDSLLELLDDETFNKIGVTGKTFQGVLTKTLPLLREVQKWIAEATQKGYEVEQAVIFEQIIQQTERVLEQFKEEWPCVDHEIVRKSREDFLQGKYKTTEELLRDAQNSGS